MTQEVTMSARYDIFKCDLCGHIVEVLHAGSSPLVCCGQEMKFLPGNSTEAALEKHVPVIEKIVGGYKVSVGSVLHPMEEKHYIEWIELVADGISYTKFLKPGDAPVAEFLVDAKDVQAREYCNLHGHWVTAK